MRLGRCQASGLAMARGPAVPASSLCRPSWPLLELSGPGRRTATCAPRERVGPWSQTQRPEPHPGVTVRSPVSPRFRLLPRTPGGCWGPGPPRAAPDLWARRGAGVRGPGCPTGLCCCGEASLTRNLLSLQVRNLTYMVTRREKIKRSACKVQEQIFSLYTKLLEQDRVPGSYGPSQGRAGVGASVTRGA